MAQHGMNVCRLAFSHGSYEHHAQLITTIRKVAKETRQPLAIMQDLQGPRIRIGVISEDGIPIEKGEEVWVVNESYYRKNKKSSRKLIPTQYAELYKNLEPKDHILISDGLIDLEVVAIENGVIMAFVEKPGLIQTHKGINVPGISISGSVITPKDMRDLRFGIQHGVDFIALSFVKSAADVEDLRRLIAKQEKTKPSMVKTKIIAKIERADAVRHLDAIIDVADGIMVARGDLGIELPPSEVPILQKQIIAKCVIAAKPVIVATQMLESMMSNSRPTRAEVSDVANAVIDHTDAMMLSGETATGQYPVESVKMMTSVITRVERSKYDDLVYKEEPLRVLNFLLYSLVKQIHQHQIRDIVLMSVADLLPKLIASLRLEKRVFVMCKDEYLSRQLNLVWGIVSYWMASLYKEKILEELRKQALIKKGEKILFIDESKLETAQEHEIFEVITAH